jgi:hypothetical protein
MVYKQTASHAGAWVAGSLLALGVIIWISSGSLPPLHSEAWNHFADTHETLVGAFLGALAAPLGIVMTDRVRERRVRDNEWRTAHYAAIINLQWQVDTMHSMAADNSHILSSIIDANDAGLPTLQRPVEITYDQTLLNTLYDMELVNRLHRLFYMVRRYNYDMANITNVLNRLAEEKFAGRLTQKQYEQEAATINPQVMHLQDSLDNELLSRIADAAAYIRICVIRDAPKAIQQGHKKILEHRKSITNQDIDDMRQQMDAEAAGN